MNQLAAFFAPTALPNAAGAVVRAAAGSSAEGFAEVLAMLQGSIGNANPAPQDLLGQLPAAQAAGELSTEKLAAELQALACNTPSARVPALDDLLKVLGPADATAGADNTAPTAILAAQFAAIQTQGSANAAQPLATSTTPNSPSVAAVPSATPAPIEPNAPIAASANAVLAELGLRGSLTQPAKTEAAPATNQPATSPDAAAVATAVAAAAQNATTNAAPKPPHREPTALAVPKRAAPAQKSEQTATPASQSDAPVPSDMPSANANAPASPSTAIAGHATNATPTDQPTDGSTAQTPQPQTIAPAQVRATLVDPQQFSATVANTPPGAVPLDALAVHIARKFSAGVSNFEISLHPADLGRLDISLTVADDGQVQAMVRAERPETLDMLQRDVRSLEHQLRQAGLDVGSNALSFSLSNGSGQQRQAPFVGWPAFADAQNAAGTAKQEAASAYIAVRQRDGIDIRV